jgi:hypothetical protein
MLYWFKRKYHQIRKTLDFLPLIWNSYDFDYRYSIDLFKKHLEYQASFLESKRAMTLEAKNNAQKIRTTISLMNKVYEDEYSTEYMDTIDKLYGTTHYDFVETDELDKNGDPYYRLELRNEGAMDEEHQKEIDEIRTQMIREGREKQRRAHKLLWDYVEHNIQRWWD